MTANVLKCGECESPMRLIEGAYGKFYGCTRWPICKGVHSAHQKTGQPMGIPANRETIEWRKKAHALLDPFIKEWFPSRTQGYKFVQNAMKMTRSQAHIAKFNIDECKILIDIIEKANKEKK